MALAQMSSEQVSPHNILAYRLLHQHIRVPRFYTPAEVVDWMGALQAQDFTAARLAIGLRTWQGTCQQVDQAIHQGTIIRTWLMRGTLHFVAAKELRGTLALLAPRLAAASAFRDRQLELNDKVLNQSRKAILQALDRQPEMTRPELYTTLERSGIPADGQRGIHILRHLAIEGRICLTSPRSKQPCFTLLERRIPSGPLPDRETSLARLTQRYFQSHGPATEQDFAWWTGLPLKDVRQGIALVASQLEKVHVAGTWYWYIHKGSAASKPTGSFLLPGFDEFLLGYRNRNLTLAPQYASRIVPGNNGIFLPIVVVGGQIVGSWKRKEVKKQTQWEFAPFTPWSSATTRSLRKPQRQIDTFWGVKSDR